MGTESAPTRLGVTGWSPSAELVEVLEQAQRRRVIGPGALADHVAHALGFAQAWPPLASAECVLDLGSGGGLPGLVLAGYLDETRFVLLEGRSERAEALSSDVRRLGWVARVDVVADRAELAARRAELRGHFDAVVARSFGVPAVTAECGAALLKVGGALVVSDPPGGGSTRRWPVGPLAELGLELESLVTTPRAFAILRSRSSSPDRYPRRVGVPSKRPLF